jgi:putative hemolysin
MKKNIRKIILFSVSAVIFIVGIILIGVYVKGNNPVSKNQTSFNLVSIFNKVGMANPASTYCGSLGYNESVDICIFPDGTNCKEWEFYRGKCGQKWSYCELKGYDLKNLSLKEGWGPDGSVCINKTTKEEIGNVFDLVNSEFVLQNSLTMNK